MKNILPILYVGILAFSPLWLSAHEMVPHLSTGNCIEIASLAESEFQEESLTHVQLMASYCGIVNYTTNSIIKTTRPPVGTSWTAFEWRFVELDPPFNTYEVISPNGTNPNFRLSWFPQVAYGRNYDVSVRVYDGAIQGEYSGVCEIGLQPNVLTTRLEQQYANQFFALCDVVGAIPVSGAEQYRWVFDDLDNTVDVFGNGNSRFLALYQVPGILMGSPYIVSVFATVNGVESPQGTLRFININNFVPNTGLNQSLYSCGATYPANTTVQAVEVCRAESYTWRLRNTSQVQPDLIYTRNDGNRFIRLDWITGIIHGDSYDLDVRARQGGLNGTYSSVCNITIEAPMTGLMDEQADIFAFSSNPDSPENALEIDAFQTSDDLVISISNPLDNAPVLLSLYDINGRLIQMKNEQVYDRGEIFWNTSDLTPGMYILKAFDGQSVSTKKITIF